MTETWIKKNTPIEYFHIPMTNGAKVRGYIKSDLSQEAALRCPQKPMPDNLLQAESSIIIH